MKASEQRAVVEALDLGKRRLWDKLPKETERAYEAFLVYKEMGQGHRSITGLSRMFGKGVGIFTIWREKYDWEIRIAAWDAKLNRERDEAALAEARRMGERQAALGMSMQKVGETRLNQFASDPALAASLTAGDTIKLIKEGAELERTARGDDPNKEKGGNIIFNITLNGTGAKGLPRWAPKELQTIEAEVINDGDQSQEAAPPATADRD